MTDSNRSGRAPASNPASPADDLRRQEEAALNTLLDVLLDKLGVDLRDWDPSALLPRLHAAAEMEGVSSPNQLLARAAEDAAVWTRIAVQLTRRPTIWFSDPPFFRVLRRTVAPWLRTYPSVRVWVPGEAGGEEAASIAILLEEENLLERTRIYATAPIDQALHGARRGQFSAASVRVGGADYALAGGHGALDRYFHWEEGGAVLHDKLRRHIVVGQHSLATDGSLNEFHLIVCRRPLLDFNARLRARAHRLFWESLPALGVLAMAPGEPPPRNLSYEAIDPALGLYRRKF
jgi:chemotaxis protein methyltransferase CheR